MDKNTKEIHDSFQADVALFMQATAKQSNVIDYMVAQAIKKGETSIALIAAKFRISENQLIKSVSSGLFRINDGKIYAL